MKMYTAFLVKERSGRNWTAQVPGFPTVWARDNNPVGTRLLLQEALAVYLRCERDEFVVQWLEVND